MLIYVNGCYFDANKPSILASDRGLLLGDGIFTTIKVINLHLIHFAEHFARLQANAHFLHIPFSFTHETLHCACLELLKANNATNETFILRITLTRGSSKRGIDIADNCAPNLIITISKFPDTVPQPLSLNISTFKRNECSPLTQIKSLNYLEAVLARREAQDLGFDDAIFMNTCGHICETTTANIFFVGNGQLYTPTLADGVLPGIMRAHVLEAAQSLNIKVTQAAIHSHTITQFDECFVTNSIIGIQKVYKINAQLFNKHSLTSLIKQQIYKLP